MKKSCFLLSLIILLLFPLLMQAQKRIWLPAKDRQVYYPNVDALFHPAPGDTLVIPTGIISFLISNFGGTKTKPIVIIPSDSGWIGGYPPYSGNFNYINHAKFTGFHIDGKKATNFGLVGGVQCSNIEICNLVISNVSSIGLCVQQIPDSTHRKGSWPGFSLENFSIHDITVKNCGTEGLYLGYTFDVTKPLAPPLLNLRLYNILTDSTGWDGVQLSNCQNVMMYNITVKNYGLKNISGQQAGILLGGMVTLRDIARNLLVTQGSGAGITIFGRGIMKIQNAKLTHVGTTPGQHAFYVSDYKDLGYGLPVLELHLKDIRVDHSAGNALLIVNGNKSLRAGTISNFTYTRTKAGIEDGFITTLVG